MKHWLVSLLALVSPAAFAQDAVPSIPFESVPNFFKLPTDMHFGEVSGVAVNSKGHIFAYSRGGSSHGPAYGNAASQVLEFDANGRFVREVGKTSTPGPSRTRCVSTRTRTSGPPTRAPT